MYSNSEHFAPGGMYYSMNNSVLKANADLAERRKRNWMNEDAMRQAGMAKENALLEMLKANTDLVRSRAARAGMQPPDFYSGDQLSYSEPQFSGWDGALRDAFSKQQRRSPGGGIDANVLAQILGGAR